jgi:NADH oxidoreductase Hcr
LCSRRAGHEIISVREGSRQPIVFRPGQFLTFRFCIAGEEIVRSYSISFSAASTALISVMVKRIDGGLVSNWLFDSLQVGDTNEADGPAYSCDAAGGGFTSATWIETDGV